MTVIEWLSSWLSSGTPRGEPLALEDRADRLEELGPRWPVQRADASVLNTFTGGGGPLDKGSAGRPNPYQAELSDEELLILYRSNGLARRIVSTLPNRATRRGWKVPEIENEDRRLRTWRAVQRACDRGDLYGGSILVPITSEHLSTSARKTPGAWLGEPLDLRKVGQVMALHVFDAWEARPHAIEDDVTSADFRLPRAWTVTTAEGFRATLHSSRVIYFPGAERPTGAGRGLRIMPDDPVLQVVWDQISQLCQTAQGGAQLAIELRESVLKIGELPAKGTSDAKGFLAATLARINRVRSSLGLILLGPKDEYETRAAGVTGFAELSESAQAMLCTALGWPRSLVTGEAPGGLSTEDAGGRERERMIVSDYQESRRSQIERLYEILYAAKDGPTAGRAPDGWTLSFEPVDQPTELATATLRKMVAESDAIYLNAGVIDPASVAETRFGDDGWSMDLVVEVPDADTLEMADKVRAEMEAAAAAGAAPAREGASNRAPDPADPREDAATGTCVLVPAADPGLAGAVERAIGQRLVVDNDPHVTILYLGELGLAEVVEVAAIVSDEAEELERWGKLELGVLTAFAPGPNGVPIVIEFETYNSGGAAELNDCLLRATAHLVRAPQHRRYRPHLTIGYAPAPLSPEALTALLAIDVSEIRIPIGGAGLQVRTGGLVVATVAG